MDSWPGKENKIKDQSFPDGGIIYLISGSQENFCLPSRPAASFGNTDHYEVQAKGSSFENQKEAEEFILSTFTFKSDHSYGMLIMGHYDDGPMMEFKKINLSVTASSD